MSKLWRPATAVPGFLLILFFLPPATARAAGRIECTSTSSRILARAVHYCALLPSNYDTNKTRRFPVLYYLHGLGEDEQMFVRSDGWQLIEDLRDQGQIGEFLIVTPDADRSFYVNSRDGRTRYEDFFIQEFLPYIGTAIVFKPIAPIAVLPAFPWAVTAPCVLLSATLNYSPRSACTAPHSWKNFPQFQFPIPGSHR